MNYQCLPGQSEPAKIGSAAPFSLRFIVPGLFTSALLLTGCGGDSGSAHSLDEPSLLRTSIEDDEEVAFDEAIEEDQQDVSPSDNVGAVPGQLYVAPPSLSVAAALTTPTVPHPPEVSAKSLAPIAAPITTRDPLPSVNSARIGAWSPIVSWPIIAIHASVLPDGRVMTFGTDSKGKQTGKFSYDVWQPFSGTGATSHLTLPNQTGTDMFCSAQLVLPLSGDLMINGGDIFDAASSRTLNQPNADVTIFKVASNSLERAGVMNRPRWYGTATTLPNGEIYLQGGKGGNDRAEVRGLDGNFRLLTGFGTDDLTYFYPRNFIGPDGNIFGIASTRMYRINPHANGGTRTNLGKIVGYGLNHRSAAVMHRPGRILQLGGTDNRASITDIRGPVPVITSAGTTSQVRIWASATVLADGRVAVTGGSATSNVADRVAYQMELFDPVTTSWTVGPSAQRMRLYHSTSLLLPDGSLLTAGGGAPGPQKNLNAEIYYPPYLFKPDGTPADRPTVTGAPSAVDPSTDFMLLSPHASSISRITLVASGSATHSVDMNQRFVELNFYRDGDRLVASMPANAYETPPGFYMVFALDTKGVPSVAQIIRVNAKY